MILLLKRLYLHVVKDGGEENVSDYTCGSQGIYKKMKNKGGGQVISFVGEKWNEMLNL